MEISEKKDPMDPTPTPTPSPPADKGPASGATAARVPSKDAAGQPIIAHGASQDRLVVTYRNDRSRRMSLLMHILRPFRPRAVASSKVFPAGSQRLQPHKLAVKSCVWKERCVANQWIYDLTPKTDFAPSPVDENGVEHPYRRVYYFCGGSWCQPPSFAHFRFLSELARRMPNTKVTVISHPLAPHASASVAVPQIAHLYETLMEESHAYGEKVVWAGDSSGGNIALCQVLLSLTNGAKHKPSAIMAICPSTDLRHLDPAINAISKKDPLMTIPFVGSTGRKWASGPDRAVHAEKHSIPNDAHYSTADPRVSPIMARLETLAENGIKVHGVTGSYDVLAPEAVVFRDRCKELGVEGEWLQWDRQMHCFPLPYGVFRESTEALEWTVDVLLRT